MWKLLKDEIPAFMVNGEFINILIHLLQQRAWSVRSFNSPIASRFLTLTISIIAILSSD
jgi:hypothetical protein